MIVVSDTTPLNYLVLINVIDVLPKLFTQVFVPPSVIDELSRLKTPDTVRAWAIAPPAWLEIVMPKQRLRSTFVLDAGEADAISLAKELNIKDVMIDERRGRRIAQQEGIFPLPTLAVLEKAAAQDLIELDAVLSALQQTNFRVPQDQILAALQRDAQRKLESDEPPRS